MKAVLFHSRVQVLAHEAVVERLVAVHGHGVVVRVGARGVGHVRRAQPDHVVPHGVGVVPRAADQHQLGVHERARVPGDAAVVAGAGQGAAAGAPAEARPRPAVQVALEVLGRGVRVVVGRAGIVVAAVHHVHGDAAVLCPLERRLDHVGADVVDRRADDRSRRGVVHQVDEVVEDRHVLRGAAGQVGEVRLQPHRPDRGDRDHLRRGPARRRDLRSLARGSDGLAARAQGEQRPRAENETAPSGRTAHTTSWREVFGPTGERRPSGLYHIIPDSDRKSNNCGGLDSRWAAQETDARRPRHHSWCRGRPLMRILAGPSPGSLEARHPLPILGEG